MPPPDTIAERVKPCLVCHAAEGRRSKDEYYPRLAGKPQGYLFNQMVNFREGRRRNRAMSLLMQHLSDDYLRECAAYFASLAPHYSAATGQSGDAPLLISKGDPARKIPACTACHGKELLGASPKQVVAEAQVLDALRGQIFALRQSFYAALGARANLEVALANRAGLDRTEALLRRQLRDGAIPEGDLLRFQASRVVFEADVMSNAQAYAAAIAQIAVTLAADAADFRPRAAARPRPAAADTLRAALSDLAFDVRGNFTLAPELGIARDELAGAVQNRPDVVAALRQSSAAGANVALAEAARWRDVTVNAGGTRSRLQQDLPSDSVPLRANNQFTLNLSVPLFTRRIVEGNVGVASGQAGQADANARAALLQARADFATAWSQVEQARSLLRLYTGGALSRAEQAYRSVEQAYSAGGSSLIEVLDALRTLNATRVAANTARMNYLTALAQLEFATGVGGIAPRL